MNSDEPFAEIETIVAECLAGRLSSVELHVRFFGGLESLSLDPARFIRVR